MKSVKLLIGVCLVSVVTGCHKPQIGDEISTAEASIKTTALAAIAAKYPSESNLKFSDLSIRMRPDGAEEVIVTYDIPGFAETATEGQRTTTTTKVIMVEISLSGKVDNVYQSQKTVTYNTPQ
jgi:hypothetical protein